MDDISQIIVNRIHRRAKRYTGTTIQLLNSEINDIPGDAETIKNEFVFTSKTWQNHYHRFISLTSNIEHLQIKDIPIILQHYPPDRAYVRYDLERLTLNYDEICIDAIPEVADFFIQAEAACDRGDFDIGINILEQVIERDRRYFPAYLVLGHTLLEYKNDPDASIKHLQHAMSILPRDYAEHYREILLELIIKAHMLNQDYASAIKTLKRLYNITQDLNHVRYLMAECYCLLGQDNYAVESLDEAHTAHFGYYALARINRNFQKIWKTIDTRLDSLANEWKDHVKELMIKMEKIEDIVNLYALHERNEIVHNHIYKLSEIKSNLGETGCYSIYRDTIYNKINSLIPVYPELVSEELEKISYERRADISDYNQNLFGEIDMRKRQMHRIGLLGWILLSCLLIYILIQNGSTPLMASIYVAAMLPLFFVPYVIIGRNMESIFTRRRIGIDAINQVRSHQKIIELLKAEIIGRIKKEGWG